MTRICRIAVLAAACGMLPAAHGQGDPDTDPSVNLALRKPVTFLPAPNYANTARGETDSTDLTDGRISARADQRIWFDTASVGWSYAGRVNVGIDLGEVEPIDEIAVRFLGGSSQPGTSHPLWVEAFVSDGPGRPYYKAGEFSRWNPGDMERFGVPRSEGAAWVHRLRFRDLKTRGRLVGLRFYSTSYTCADEVYVFKGRHDPAAARFDAAALSDFTVSAAQMYFHKPYVPVSPDIVAPLGIGMVAAAAAQAMPMTVSLTLPEGVRIAGGTLGGVRAETARLSDSSYRWQFPTRGVSDQTFSRLWITGTPQAPGAYLTYRLTWGDYQSPEMRVPVTAVAIPAGSRPARLTTSLSWFQLEITREWPEWRQAFERIGLNTLPVFTNGFNPADTGTIEFVAAAREMGYRIQAIDSTWHQLLSRRKNEREIYCQFADGGAGAKLCPSYRGRFFQEELERVATGVRLLKPDLLHCDIELWSGNDAQKCTRCQADKEASRIASWSEWQLAKGEESWTALAESTRRAAAESGGPAVEMGLYDGRPGENYQGFYPFDRLYPLQMQTSQVSTYTSLEPYHIAFIGDEARRDRARLPRSDQIPWITPGNGGTFPGEALYYALLECYFNGSRGVNFWNARMWDAESLAAYARAIRTAAAVEHVIAGGDPFTPQLATAGRASGMRLGGEIILLAADYFGEAGGRVRVNLDLPLAAAVIDLERGTMIARLPAGAVQLNVDVAKGAATALHLKPVEETQ